jgi:hypothetical protein
VASSAKTTGLERGTWHYLFPGFDDDGHRCLDCSCTNQPTAQPCEIQDRFGLSLSRVTDWLAPTIGSGVSCRAPLYAAPPWTYGPSSTDSAAEEETSMNQTRPRAPGLGSLIIASFPTSGLHYRALSGSPGALASGRVGRGRPGCRSIAPQHGGAESERRWARPK